MPILTASIRDLNALRRLERACFEKDAWSLFDLVAVLTLPDVIRLKAMEGGEMAGFIAGDPRASLGWTWVATIGVDPRYRRRGLGRALLQACEARMRLPLARLTVRISNQPAVALYEAEGYEKVDLWRSYYSDGEDAVVMQKRLHENPSGAA